MREKIINILKESINIKEKIILEYIEDILKISNLLLRCLKKGGKIILFGNGGSAADSQHIAAELIGRFKKDRPAISAIALTTNSSILTAISNDYGFEFVFAKQIEGLASKNDVVIGISTSGNPENVINGIKKAKEIGLKTIALTGSGGGKLSKIVDMALIVPSKNTARIQEAHITIGHVICEFLEEELFKTKK